MSEPAKDEAKDEAELQDRVAAVLFCNKDDNNLSCIELANIVFTTVRAAGWAVVPITPTEEMRRACWLAQYKYANATLSKPQPNEKVQQLVQSRMDDKSQRKQDHAAYAATLAAAPMVKL